VNIHSRLLYEVHQRRRSPLSIHACLLCYLQDLKDHADPQLVLCLAGNKCDLTPTFDLEQCRQYADSIDAFFILTSALTGEGAVEVFNTLANRVYEKYGSGGLKLRSAIGARRVDASDTSTEQEVSKSKSRCC
jgi:GTPase SAR1 family protein